MVKGGSVGIGTRSVLQDMGVNKGIRLSTDASAAKGIASRKGLGKVRHIEVNQLWLQDKVGKGEIEVKKVSGGTNIADALTKHVASEKIHRHCESVQLEMRQSRHELMPKVAEDESHV